MRTRFDAAPPTFEQVWPTAPFAPLIGLAVALGRLVRRRLDRAGRGGGVVNASRRLLRT